ncbi:MAG: GIY-YIG nuclease family protein [Bacteroidota bacterium]
MLLPYGEKEGKLIHISEVPSGRTDLHCPYCGAALLAKKGKQNAHHFAHLEQSCLHSGSAALLGLGKKLPLQLSLSEYVQRKWQDFQQAKYRLQKQHDFLNGRNTQHQHQLKTLVAYLRTYQMSEQTQAVVAYIRDEFNSQPLLDNLPASFTQHRKAVQQYHSTKQELAETAFRLALYQRELVWFNRFQLYFLEIRVNAYHIFYKIGLTARQLSERLQEIRQDLKSFPSFQIQVLFQSNGVAFLETFFKQKYQSKRYSFGKHTEYFTFAYYELQDVQKEFEQIQMFLQKHYNK